MMLWKCCTQYASKFGILRSGHRAGKSQFSFQPQRRQGQRMSNECTIALISHGRKAMLKILHTKLQEYGNHELANVQAGFIKGRGMRNQSPTSVGWSKKQESSRETSISTLLMMPKLLTVWITINCEKSERDRNTRSPYLHPEKSACRLRSKS